jgi:methyl-accepting chemotaxis protein
MSATSEELAAQAEQLQSSIAFFKVDGESRAAPAARRAGAPTQTAAPAAKLPAMASPSLAPKPAKAAPPARRAATPVRRAANGRGNGVTIDLGAGGADAHDAEFERY